jgi:hypothetical protein
MSYSTARPRVELSARTALLAAGDLLGILGFVVVGEYTHGYNPLVDVGRVAGTFVPFLVGWLLVAGAAGLFAGDAPTTLGRTVAVTFSSWVLAVVVAQALRATAFFHGDAALTFAVVSVVIGGVVLCLWRAGATLALGE